MNGKYKVPKFITLANDINAFEKYVHKCDKLKCYKIYKCLLSNNLSLITKLINKSPFILNNITDFPDLRQNVINIVDTYSLEFNKVVFENLAKKLNCGNILKITDENISAQFISDQYKSNMSPKNIKTYIKQKLLSNLLSDIIFVENLFNQIDFDIFEYLGYDIWTYESLSLLLTYKKFKLDKLLTFDATKILNITINSEAFIHYFNNIQQMFIEHIFSLNIPYTLSPEFVRKITCISNDINCNMQNMKCFVLAVLNNKETRYESSSFLQLSLNIVKHNLSDDEFLVIVRSIDMDKYLDKNNLYRYKVLSDDEKDIDINKFLDDDMVISPIIARYIEENILPLNSNVYAIEKYLEYVTRTKDDANNFYDNIAFNIEKLDDIYHTLIQYLPKLPLYVYKYYLDKLNKTLSSIKLSKLTHFNNTDITYNVLLKLKACGTPHKQSSNLPKCLVCLTNDINIALTCGHTICSDCIKSINVTSPTFKKCPQCAKKSNISKLIEIKF